MNKNDHRFQKTEIAIKDAYRRLKKHGSQEVRVKDLCETAMINKTTFYTHYDSIEALHRQICTEFVSEMLKYCEHIEDIPSNSRAFVISIHKQFAGNSDTIKKLYGPDLYSLVNDIETLLMKSYIPDGIDENAELAIRFCIGGAFRILVYETDMTRIDKTIELVERIFMESMNHQKVFSKKKMN